MTDQEGPRFSDDVLSAYLDGELSAGDRNAVEARLANDELWRRILDDVTAARDLVRHLPEREPPTGFWLRVLTNVAEVAESDARLGAAAAVVPISRPAARRAPRWSAIAGAAAAVVVGVAVAAPARPHHVSPNV